MRLATKLDRMVTYHEELPPVKSHDPLITLHYEIAWQYETIISPLPHCVWPTKLVGCWHTLRGSIPITSRGLARSCNK